MTTEAIVLNRFTSAKPDGADTTVYRPSDHNASRKFTTGTDGDILLRDSSKATSGASWLASVATGQFLVSQGAGSLPAWSNTLPAIITLTITQGTITSDAPQLNGTVTWNNAGIVGPAWKLNVTDTSSNVGALLIEFQVGGASKFSLTKSGLVTTAGITVGGGTATAGSLRSGTGTGGIDAQNAALNVGSAVAIGWSSGDPFSVAKDLIMVRDATATLQIGVDAASPVAQTFKAHDGSGTDKTGASLTLAGGNGTGTGLGGALIFNTTPAAGGSGSSQNTSTERGRFTSPGHFVLTELTTDPGTGDLAANGAMALYNKNNKIVFAFNNAGTITYCTLAMDGSSVLWAQGTGAP